MGDDTTWMDATAQAELVRRGEVSPAELVDAAIERIERIDPQLNAVIHPRFDQARKEAAGALPDGPFRGVPLLLKDLGAMSEGDPYHGGSKFLKELDFRADHDTFLVRRFREAGFVIVGRTNTPEFGSTITTEPESHGPCRNPWNLDHSTGGSSGGSAAAVAAGLAPAAHANDGGGSIRIPASECGLVGLKPTRGRVSAGPDTGEAWMGATIDGAVTRTVRDTAAILDAISGREPGDPYDAPALPGPLAAEVGAPVGRLRIGIDASPTNDAPVHPECVAAVDAAARLLESLGHVVERARPAAIAEPEFQRHFITILAADTVADFDGWSARIGRPVTADDVEASNWTFYEIGTTVTAGAYLASVRWMHGFQRRIATWWTDPGGYDLLVTPVLAGPPPRIGELSDPEHGLARLTALLQYTAQFNVSGQPAISLPLHWTADGLPVGVQLVADFGREDLLVRIAAQLEDAQPWAHLMPPTHA